MHSAHRVVLKGCVARAGGLRLTPKLTCQLGTTGTSGACTGARETPTQETRMASTGAHRGAELACSAILCASAHNLAERGAGAPL